MRQVFRTPTPEANEKSDHPVSQRCVRRRLGPRFLARTKAEEGLSHRRDVVTAFDLIELREGRLICTEEDSLGGLAQVQALPELSGPFHKTSITVNKPASL